MRINSAGSLFTSFAVIITNTWLFFSCNHVRKDPSNRFVISPVDEPPLTPEKAFSISSIHKTHGDISSAIFIALRIFCSDSPTYLPIMRPISNRNNGALKSLAVALALNDLPQPGIPAIRTPFGISTPKALAASISLYIFALF